MIIAGAIYFIVSSGFFKTFSPSIDHTSQPGILETGYPISINKIVPGVDFIPLVKRVRPAVVKVKSESEVARRQSLFDDDFPGNFFDTPRRNHETVTGMGAGFFISPDGYIVTNNHVVENASKIIVTDIEEKEYTAKKIGNDPRTDLALIKINSKNHLYINLGDSDKAEVGDWVLAIGNPLEQDMSVTSGIVSAKGRQFSGLEVDYQDYIQTDTPINRGNSGGPLINMSGEAIGINSIILSTSGGNIGLGFAIPSNMAKKVIGDLKKLRRVIRGYMGIQIGVLPDSDAEQYGYPLGGVIVVKVEKNSPAELVGIQKYDLITEVDGKRVKTMVELRTLVAAHNPGEIVKLTLFTGAKKTKKTISVKVIEMPDRLN